MLSPAAFCATLAAIAVLAVAADAHDLSSELISTSPAHVSAFGTSRRRNRIARERGLGSAALHGVSRPFIIPRPVARRRSGRVVRRARST